MAAVVSLVARSLQVEGSFASGALGQHTTKLVRNRVVAKVSGVFFAIHQCIDETLQALGGQQDRPSNLFPLAVHVAAQNPLDADFHEAIVAVGVQVQAAEAIRRGQAPDEILNGDLTVAELRFQEGLAVVSDVLVLAEDLAIGRPDQLVHVTAREDVFDCVNFRLLFTAHFVTSHTLVLRRRGEAQYRNSHVRISVVSVVSKSHGLC